MDTTVLKIAVIFIVVLIFPCEGLDCYVCVDTNYDGEIHQTCFKTVSGTTTIYTCTADSGSTVHYCGTKFVVTDGVTTSVERYCMASTSDEDVYTDAVPSSTNCKTYLDEWGNPTSTTECYYHCTTDNCNNITTSSLKQCSSDCNIGTSQGSCNYITGTCVCSSPYAGSDCSTPQVYATRKSCVQCNSETESGCISFTTSTTCPGTENYCSTTTSTIYDSAFAIVKSTITRGCTSNLRAVDECRFNDVYTDFPINDASLGYKEFNCYSTCDTNGCNNGTADGIINGNEAVTLQCVVCTDSVGAGTCNTATVRQACPSGSTYCKSTVTYLISEKNDLRHRASPTYHLVSVVRECANFSIPTQCTESNVEAMSFKKITCSETCQEDGCNIGWPGRPKCLTCSSSQNYNNKYDDDGYDQCRENPPIATPCSFPYETHCIIQEHGIQKSYIPGIPRRITRGCSYYDIGNECSSTMIRNITIQNCNYTCTTDGCNIGGASTESLQAVVAAVVFNP
ncbi:uncharacterized protein LOC120330380 [Styela clava]